MPSGEETKRIKRRPSESTEAEVDAPAKAERADTAEIDSLIDEIDEVLEENAEEFVRSYIQKGGE